MFLVGLKMVGYGRTLAKYNLTVIIASCLNVCCLLTVHNILHKFYNTQRDDLSQMKLLIPLPTYPKREKRRDF